VHLDFTSCQVISYISHNSTCRLNVLVGVVFPAGRNPLRSSSADAVDGKLDPNYNEKILEEVKLNLHRIDKVSHKLLFRLDSFLPKLDHYLLTPLANSLRIHKPTYLERR